MTRNLAASIQARLLNRAKANGEDFNLVLTRYADFLGFGPMDIDALAVTVREICNVAADDGMTFDSGSIVIEEIREDARYGGLRVRLLGRLGNARCSVQLDAGYGDAVMPGPEEAIYPTLLDDQSAPRLRVYPRAAVAAEKLEAVVSLGMANSRMKDFFDLRALARESLLDTQMLADALAATFQRRGTVFPVELPLGLSDEFAHDAGKRAQWKAFLNKNRLDAPPLDVVIEEVRRFVAEPMALARQKIASVRP